MPHPHRSPCSPPPPDTAEDHLLSTIATPWLASSSQLLRWAQSQQKMSTIDIINTALDIVDSIDNQHGGLAAAGAGAGAGASGSSASATTATTSPSCHNGHRRGRNNARRSRSRSRSRSSLHSSPSRRSTSHQNPDDDDDQ